MLAINEIILKKLDELDIPDKMKNILKEILRIEEEMKILGSKRDYKNNMSKILEKYADDEDVMEFCSRYGQ